MDRLKDSINEGVVLLDARVVHDIATTLTGDWRPEDEPDELRRAQLVAAARLRIYGDRDFYGLKLAATPIARDQAMGYDGADWSVGFIQDISTIEGAPPGDDVVALEAILQADGIAQVSATCLAYALLFELVSYVITPVPSDLRHQRVSDLPRRLEVVDPVEAVLRLGLVAGEAPIVGPPPATALALGPAWWVS